MMDAYPTPWRAKDIPDREDSTRVARESIVSADGIEMVPDVIDGFERDRIIRAVNSHDALVAALEAVVSLSDEQVRHQGWPRSNESQAVYDMCAAAIAKAAS